MAHHLILQVVSSFPEDLLAGRESCLAERPIEPGVLGVVQPSPDVSLASACCGHRVIMVSRTRWPGNGRTKP
jgi:hypothetical protein